MKLLHLEGVAAGYRAGEWVIEAIDLVLEDRDFLALIGPNGCGKSTLLRTMAGVIPEWKGRISVGGNELGELNRRDLARFIAVVPQETPALIGFEVRQLVAMGRYPHLGRLQKPGPEDHRLVDAALERTATTRFVGRRIDELSGGERQRVFIARALAQDPRILLLDEPTSNLDINYQIEVFDLLYQLNREEGLTLVCATHDLNYAAFYSRRVGLMNAGRICALGAAREVYDAARIAEIYGVRVRLERGPRVVPLSRRVEERRHSDE